MSQSIIDALKSQLSGDTISQIASQVGVSPQQAQSAVGVALPTLVAALAGNASSQDGASSLASALQRDHQNTNVNGLLGSIGQLATSGAGAAILGHVLGGKQQNAQTEIGQKTGLNPQQIATILGILAPIVMAYLGNKQKQEGLDAGGIQKVLDQEKRVAEQEVGGAGLGGLLGSLLGGAGGGQGQQGDLKQELIGQGLKALGGFLNRK